MRHLDLLRSIDLVGVRERGSILPNELPRLRLLGRLLLRKGMARQSASKRWFATELGRITLEGKDHDR